MLLIDNIDNSSIRDLEKDIINDLNNIGLFYRIFTRVKTKDSIIEKLEKKDYSNEKKMQDLIGIRIVLYFNEDIEVCKRILEKNFSLIESVIDSPDSSTFKPSRVNLIFKMPDNYLYPFEEIYKSYLIDKTFEVQLRTVFSEGWHEIEHDLRYKCKDEWNEFPDLSRALNGIVATLETCDWNILHLFDELAYKNYKSTKWEAMIKNKYRIRMKKGEMSEKLSCFFDSNPRVAKEFFKLSKKEIIPKLIEKKLNIPLNITNVIFIVNYFFVQNEHICNITPELLLKKLSK